MHPREIVIALGAPLALALAACDGGSSSPPPANGVLVVPGEAAEVAAAALASRGARALPRNADCPAVPDGYRPLAGASIVWTDANDVPVGAPFESDACGGFTAAVPAEATALRAEGEGFRPLVSDVSLFRASAGAPGVASTIADTAAYRIGAIQALDDAVLGFTVTDSESGRAVLGLPAAVFVVTLDAASAPVASIRVAASTATNASTVMVLDASRSMDELAYVDPDTDERFERRQLAALAAHAFLDRKDPEDEVAPLLFSDELFFMDRETVDRVIPLVDATSGEPTAFLASEDGFASDAARLRPIVDSYNRRSALYTDGTDAPHPDTPDGLRIDGRYPYEGATALYDAIGEGVARLDARNVLRPVVVAMTDGEDNMSRRDEATLVDEAIEANVPVYTIGFGGDTEEDVLTRIAERTGGSFFSVTSIEIADVYQSIQTGILFQYIATLSEGGLDEAFTLGVELDYNGLRAERTLTVSR